MATSMLPSPEILPDVLPAGRISATGRPDPELRSELRQIPGARNAVTVVGAYAQSFGVIAAASLIGRWWAYAIAFVLMGRAFALLAILAHESAHRLLFSSKKVNDTVGRWLLGYPAFIPFDLYRRSHMAHHRDELGPNEPDLALYAGYPITRRSLRRKLARDAGFVSGWKNLRPLLRAVTRRETRPLALRMIGVQVVIAVVLGVIGPWWLYPVLWLAPWMTVWRVINRLRVIAEHGGMTRSDDKRLTTHLVRQRPLARFFMVPYNTGWHLAHHVDMGIPFRHLPQLQRELVAAGWLSDALEYPSYTALWRTLSSRPERLEPIS